MLEIKSLSKYFYIICVKRQITIFCSSLKVISPCKLIMSACEFIGKELISCTDNSKIIENTASTKCIMQPIQILLIISQNLYVLKIYMSSKYIIYMSLKIISGLKCCNYKCSIKMLIIGLLYYI